MREPGLDDRHRDKNAPKSGEIQQKRHTSRCTVFRISC
jgi:hypothetical protein